MTLDVDSLSDHDSDRIAVWRTAEHRTADSWPTHRSRQRRRRRRRSSLRRRKSHTLRAEQ